MSTWPQKLVIVLLFSTGPIVLWLFKPPTLLLFVGYYVVGAFVACLVFLAITGVAAKIHGRRNRKSD